MGKPEIEVAYSTCTRRARAPASRRRSRSAATIAGDKMEGDEKERVQETVREANEWLDGNPGADKEDYAEKLKELEDVRNHICYYG
ncbi:hypothetical protein ACP70R_010692 [Stipagrostis hirtigluma subsp. patula]